MKYFLWSMAVLCILAMADCGSGGNRFQNGKVTGRSYTPASSHWVPSVGKVPGHMNYTPPKYYLYIEMSSGMCHVSVPSSDYESRRDGEACVVRDRMGGLTGWVWYREALFPE